MSAGTLKSSAKVNSRPCKPYMKAGPIIGTSDTKGPSPTPSQYDSHKSYDRRSMPFRQFFSKSLYLPGLVLPEIYGAFPIRLAVSHSNGLVRAHTYIHWYVRRNTHISLHVMYLYYKYYTYPLFENGLRHSLPKHPRQCHSQECFLLLADFGPFLKQLRETKPFITMKP